jgi:hypothetical protein
MDPFTLIKVISSLGKSTSCPRHDILPTPPPPGLTVIFFRKEVEGGPRNVGLSLGLMERDIDARWRDLWAFLAPFYLVLFLFYRFFVPLYCSLLSLEEYYSQLNWWYLHCNTIITMGTSNPLGYYFLLFGWTAMYFPRKITMLHAIKRRKWNVFTKPSRIMYVSWLYHQTIFCKEQPGV